MANFDTTLFTDQNAAGTNLYGNPSLRDAQNPLRVFRQTITLTGNELAADKIRLGFPRLPNFRIIPELCRLVCPSGAGCAFIMTLKKVGTDGTETALSAAATQVAASSVALARPATVPDVPVVTEDDYLMLLLGTKTTATAASVLLVEIVGYSPEAS